MKKSWISESGAGLVSITLESNLASDFPIPCSQLTFPDKPTEENPLRHVITINCLTRNDLINLRNTIQEHLNIT